MTYFWLIHTNRDKFRNIFITGFRDFRPRFLHRGNHRGVRNKNRVDRVLGTIGTLKTWYRDVFVLLVPTWYRSTGTYDNTIVKMYWLLVGFESIIKLLFNKYPIMILPSGPARGFPVYLGAEPSPSWQSLSLDSHNHKPFWADHSLTLPTE